MHADPRASRRRFLKGSLLAGLTTFTGLRLPTPSFAADSPAPLPPTRVALMHGDSRADIAFRSLQPFANQIAQAIGSRRIVIKPNNVAIDVQLCATHAETIEGILEFLKSINKLDNVVIAESAANGPTLDGFANYGYNKVADKYNAKLLDLDQDAVQILHVFDEKTFRPQPVRMCKTLLDPNSYIISAARMKTHDRIVATLSLKNIVVGAPIKDPGFRWGGGKPGAKNDKPFIHGSGHRSTNYNLFALAQRLHPHLAIIDGFQGMQGNGPVGGSPVDHRVCVASPDWLAADRVAVELMGIDYANVGYLNYAASANLGQADLAKMEILGEQIAPHIRKYKLADNFNEQLIWMKPPKIT